MPMLAGVAGAAASAGARRVVVVGPRRPGLWDEERGQAGALIYVREDPPGAGPVHALRAGLSEVTAPVMVLLAADLPFLRARHVRALIEGLSQSSAGVVMLDDAGWPQWLIGGWRTAVLRAALRGYRGRSLHGLLGGLEPVMLRYAVADGEVPPWLDCDTPEDLARARKLAASGGQGGLDREVSR